VNDAESAGRPAVFVDRDGTIIREKDYLSDPAGVELLPGAAAGLRAFADAGYAIVIVTNQSGIGRGYFTEGEYRSVQRRVLELLERDGVTVLASYHCPHHPDHTGPCDCRKPAPGMSVRAIREHGLDAARSIWIGDRLRDVTAAKELGGDAVLVRTGYGLEEAPDAPDDVRVVDDLAAAARLLPGSARAVDTHGDDG
jgi:D-glycero-D-manno-heptose 1,7-bisphosphate phosphatase